MVILLKLLIVSLSFRFSTTFPKSFLTLGSILKLSDVSVSLNWFVLMWLMFVVYSIHSFNKYYFEYIIHSLHCSWYWGYSSEKRQSLLLWILYGVYSNENIPKGVLFSYSWTLCNANFLLPIKEYLSWLPLDILDDNCQTTFTTFLF